jgi:predicted metalloprotease
LRFVMPTKTEPKVQYDNRTHKRRSDDDDIVHKTLLEMCGNDSWSPVLCGYAHKLKRPKLQLYDDVVRNAMVGVY